MQEIVQAYHPKNAPEVIAMKTEEFWWSMKHFPYEPVDEYYNWFHDFLDNLSNDQTVITTASTIQHFIFTWGSEFESLQNNYWQGWLWSS
jgi:hypothetical protein